MEREKNIIRRGSLHKNKMERGEKEVIIYKCCRFESNINLNNELLTIFLRQIAQ